MLLDSLQDELMLLLYSCQLCRTFTVRLEETLKKQEDDDLKMREIVGKQGDELKKLQQLRDSLRNTQQQTNSDIEEYQAALKSLRHDMETELAVQVDIAHTVKSIYMTFYPHCDVLMQTLQELFYGSSSLHNDMDSLII